MTTLEREPIQLLGYLEGRIEEQSAAIQEIKDGQQQILARFDQMQTFMVHRMDQIHAEVNDKIDRAHAESNNKIDRAYAELNNKIDQVEARVSNRIDRVFMALAGLATGIIVTQFGVIVTLLLR